MPAMIVIARCAWRAVAIQLDCFVVPRGGTSRNDKPPLGYKLRKQSDGLIRRRRKRLGMLASAETTRIVSATTV